METNLPTGGVSLRDWIAVTAPVAFIERVIGEDPLTFAYAHKMGVPDGGLDEWSEFVLSLHSFVRYRYADEMLKERDHK